MSSQPLVAVLDYGSGNVHSAVKALAAAGADARLTSDRASSARRDGLVVPGVGAFRAVMDALRAEPWRRTHRSGSPAGARARASASACRCSSSAAWSAASTPRGRRVAGRGHRARAPVLPHMGWNTVQAGEGSRLFRGIEDERFYFVHSFGAQKWPLDVAAAVPAARPDVVRLRRAVPRRRRERAAVGDPVPPREVGGCRHPTAGELDRRAPQGYPLNSCHLRERALARYPARGAMNDFASTPELSSCPLSTSPTAGRPPDPGEAGTETNYGDPVDAALDFARQGAEWIHLVDLDAAFGRGSNAGVSQGHQAGPGRAGGALGRHPRRRTLEAALESGPPASTSAPPRSRTPSGPPTSSAATATRSP